MAYWCGWGPGALDLSQNQKKKKENKTKNTNIFGDTTNVLKSTYEI